MNARECLTDPGTESPDIFYVPPVLFTLCSASFFSSELGLSDDEGVAFEELEQ